MRNQAVKNTGTGAAYVTHHGKKLPLENFERCSGDYIYHKGKSLKVHGWYSIGYFGAYGIHMSDDGETAIVFYRQN